MARCKSTSECQFLEYCDPTIKRCDKCSLLCHRKIGHYMECQELCPNFKSQHLMATAVASTWTAFGFTTQATFGKNYDITEDDSGPMHWTLISMIGLLVVCLMILSLFVHRKTIRGQKIWLPVPKTPNDRKNIAFISIDNGHHESKATIPMVNKDLRSEGPDTKIFSGKPKGKGPSIEETPMLSKESNVIAEVHREQHQRQREDTGRDPLKDKGILETINNQGTIDALNRPQTNVFTVEELERSGQAMKRGVSQGESQILISSVRSKYSPVFKDGSLGQVHGNTRNKKKNKARQTEAGSLGSKKGLMKIGKRNHSGEKVTTLSDTNKEVPSNQDDQEATKVTYGILRRISYVEGYFSEGDVIDVFVNLDNHNASSILQDLVHRTGQGQDKFCVKDTTEM